MANCVTLVVEGPTDLGIVQALLLLTRIPLDELLVVAAGGRERLLLAKSLRRPGDQLVVLVDADGRDPAEVRGRLEQGLGAADLTVFVAVPNIDAWVLDDDALAVGVSKTREGVGRLTGDAVGGSDLDLVTFALLGDVEHAAARSPSLRHFLAGISKLLGAPTDRFDRVGAGKSLSRDIIAGLLREVEASEVVWKPSNGEPSLTADQMLVHVETGTEQGRSTHRICCASAGTC